MFSHAFILGFLDFVVSILFLSPFRLHNIYWISAHYKQSVRFQEENHDGRWSMYLPCSRCTGSAFVLRCLTINQAVWIRHDKGIDQSSIRQLSHVQGASETPWIYGIPRQVYHLGCGNCRWRYSQFYHSVLHPRICCRTHHPCCHSMHWCCTYLFQTKERIAHQERGTWRIHLC